MLLESTWKQKHELFGSDPHLCFVCVSSLEEDQVHLFLNCVHRLLDSKLFPDDTTSKTKRSAKAFMFVEEENNVHLMTPPPSFELLFEVPSSWF